MNLNTNEFNSLSDMVYHALYEGITEGRYQGGELLTESRIATELGVSRTPVREALKQLEREDLVISQPNKGVIVRSLQTTDYADIYTIRALLEGQAAYWAAQRIEQEELDRMEEILELMDLYTRRNDIPHLLHFDSDFHEIIYKACKSPTIRSLLVNIHHILRSKRQSSYTLEGRAALSLNEHRAIFNAISAHDAKSAKSAAESHIMNAWHANPAN